MSCVRSVVSIKDFYDEGERLYGKGRTNDLFEAK